MKTEESLARAFRLMENGEIHVQLTCENPIKERMENPTYCPGCHCKHKQSNADKLLDAMDEYYAAAQDQEETQILD